MKVIHILYVDDSPFDRGLVLDSLEKEHGGFQVMQAASRADFETALAHGNFDLILSDFNILGFEGLQVLEAVHAKNPDLPVIIVTGTGSEEIAVEAMKRGAADYIIKTPRHIQRLPLTIQAVLDRKLLKEDRDRLFNLSLDLLCVAGFDGYFKQLNPAWERTLGWSNKELLSKPYVVFVHPDDREATSQASATLADGHLVYFFENRYLCKDGSYKWISWNSYPLVDESLMFGVARDITERKRAEEKILQQIERLTALREIDQSITSDFDLDHSLTTLISRTVALLNVDAATVLLLQPETHTLSYGAGFGFRTNAPETASVKLGDSYAGKAALEKRLVQIPNLAEEPDNLFLTGFLKGEDFVSYHGAPLIVKGEVVGALEVLNRSLIERDQDWLDFFITLAGQAAIAIANAQLFLKLQSELQERLRTEEEIRELNLKLEQRVAERTIELERALKVKDEFLANMSHELRTPLNAILGMSESLEEGIGGDLSEKQTKYIRTINESGHHLLNLINDILDLAKIGAGQTKMDIVKVDLQDICRSSLRMVQQLAQKNRLEVSFSMEEDITLIWADARRLKQMIVNLLSNAVKFTPEGGRFGLEVSAKHQDHQVWITVWDQGIGISQDDLQRLFKPFVQVDSKLSRNSSGTGLGLALVAEMARLHGGQVLVSSSPGKGSRFTIVLPWKPAEKTGSLGVVQTALSSTNLKSQAVPEYTILLAEDTASAAMMVGDYLTVAGYEVVIAENGMDAITQAELLLPDLILMDVMMPAMDGLEATKRIRDVSALRTTPILGLTALAMPGDQEKCLEAGMNDHIAKPVKLADLLRTIRAYLPPKD